MFEFAHNIGSQMPEWELPGRGIAFLFATAILVAATWLANGTEDEKTYKPAERFAMARISGACWTGFLVLAFLFMSELYAHDMTNWWRPLKLWLYVLVWGAVFLGVRSRSLKYRDTIAVFFGYTVVGVAMVAVLITGLGGRSAKIHAERHTNNEYDTWGVTLATSGSYGEPKTVRMSVGDGYVAFYYQDSHGYYGTLNCVTVPATAIRFKVAKEKNYNDDHGHSLPSLCRYRTDETWYSYYNGKSTPHTTKIDENFVVYLSADDGYDQIPVECRGDVMRAEDAEQDSAA